MNNFPPIDGSHHKVIQSNDSGEPVSQKKAKTRGYLWKIITPITNQIYRFIGLIFSAIKNFHKTLDPLTSRKVEEVKQEGSKTEVVFKKSLSKSTEVLDPALATIYKSPSPQPVVSEQKSLKSLKSESSDEGNKQELNADADVDVDVDLTSLFNADMEEEHQDTSAVEEDLSASRDELDENLYEEVFEDLSASQGFDEEDPLSDMGTTLPENLTANDIDIVSNLTEEDIIKQQLLEFELLDEAQALLKPANDVLKELSEKKAKDVLLTLDDYIAFHHRLNDEFEALKKSASIYEEGSPFSHELVQNMIKDLEAQMDLLESEFCSKVQKNYTPNNEIPGDGNCMFWSIAAQQPEDKKPRELRKLAGDYIRANALNKSLQHFDTINTGIEDTLNGWSYKAYKNYKIVLKGGLSNWEKDFRRRYKIGKEKEITIADLYSDYLENTRLWGGFIELVALSEQMKTPIFVFDARDGKNWKFNAKVGEIKYRDKFPLLLYYVGNSHYQNLVPIKSSEKA